MLGVGVEELCSSAWKNTVELFQIKEEKDEAIVQEADKEQETVHAEDEKGITISNLGAGSRNICLLLTIGLPGSGKSFFCKKLQEESKMNIEIFEADAIEGKLLQNRAIDRETRFNEETA